MLSHYHLASIAADDKKDADLMLTFMMFKKQFPNAYAKYKKLFALHDVGFVQQELKRSR